MKSGSFFLAHFLGFFFGFSSSIEKKQRSPITKLKWRKKRMVSLIARKIECMQ